jgi:hypothetical protein
MDITVTDAQLKALRKLDATLTAKQVVQIHVDTWLLPLIDEAVVSEAAAVKAAYIAASDPVKSAVRTELGLG